MFCFVCALPSLFCFVCCCVAFCVALCHHRGSLSLCFALFCFDLRSCVFCSLSVCLSLFVYVFFLFIVRVQEAASSPSLAEYDLTSLPVDIMQPVVLQCLHHSPRMSVCLSVCCISVCFCLVCVVCFVVLCAVVVLLFVLCGLCCNSLKSLSLFLIIIYICICFVILSLTT